MFDKAVSFTLCDIEFGRIQFNEKILSLIMMIYLNMLIKNTNGTFQNKQNNITDYFKHQLLSYPLLAGGYEKEVFIMSKYKAIVVANQKSGVGKTTITENVAIGKQIRQFIWK